MPPERRRRLRRCGTERYPWEKARILLDEVERRKTGGTEHDTGLTVEELRFHAEYTEVAANAELAAAMGVPVGTCLLRRTYWTSARADHAPLSVSYSYLVRDMVGLNPDLLDASKEPWPGGTHHQLSTVGIEVDRIVDVVTARPPSPDEAELFCVGPGVSCITVRKISYDTGGRVVEVADIVFPGDRTELVYTTALPRISTRMVTGS